MYLVYVVTVEVRSLYFLEPKIIKKHTFNQNILHSLPHNKDEFGRFDCMDNFFMRICGTAQQN